MTKVANKEYHSDSTSKEIIFVKFAPNAMDNASTLFFTLVKCIIRNHARKNFFMDGISILGIDN